MEMIEKIDVEALKKADSNFKNSDEYTRRKSQFRFSELARLIIENCLKKILKQNYKLV